MVLKSGHEETEENLINFLESRLQDHERLRGGLYYIQNIPRDENWKVLKSVLQNFVPPAKYEEGLFYCFSYYSNKTIHLKFFIKGSCTEKMEKLKLLENELSNVSLSPKYNISCSNYIICLKI